MDALLKDIQRKIVEIREGEPETQKKMMERVDRWLAQNIEHILVTRFSSKLSSKSTKMTLLGMGGTSVVVKIKDKIFRITIIEPRAEYEKKIRYEMDTLQSHDFGILAPIDYYFIPESKRDNGIWWYEIVEAFPYQGATLKEYSEILHKVLKLANYNLFWNDIHNDNFMRDPKGRLVIVDFDTGSVDEYIKSSIRVFKNTKISDIKPWLDKFFTGWQDIKRLRYMIYAYLGIPVTNENWMKFCFGEFMYRAKYNIEFRYPTRMFEAQVRYKGAIPF